MIRILIIDDQKSVLQALRELIDSQAKLKIVGTAENGQEGIELVEQLQPDVAIIDLSMPLKNGIETTHLIGKNYPKTKVIILTGSDGQMLNQAILAGANGYLLKNTSRESLIAAIYAVNRNSIYISEGILDPSTFLSPSPKQSKLENISLWLAKELINWWCDRSNFSTPSMDYMVESLNLNVSGFTWMKNYLCQEEKINLLPIKELKQKVESSFAQVKKSVNTPYYLSENKPQEIANWFNSENNIDFYNSFLTKIHDNFQSLRIVTLEKLQKVISPLWQKAAPLPLLNCLQSVEQYLLDYQHFLDEQRELNLAKESSAWHSFHYLSDRLLKAEKRNRTQQLELCQKAIIFIYQCKIEVQLNNLLSRLILEIVQKLRTYINTLIKTQELLQDSKRQLQKDIKLDASLSKLSPLVREKILPEELRRDFEKWAGHSLNQWGVVTSISESEIKNRLIRKLRPIVQEIYSSLDRKAS